MDLVDGINNQTEQLKRVQNDKQILIELVSQAEGNELLLESEDVFSQLMELGKQMELLVLTIQYTNQLTLTMSDDKISIDAIIDKAAGVDALLGYYDQALEAANAIDPRVYATQAGSKLQESIQVLEKNRKETLALKKGMDEILKCIVLDNKN